jgi:Arc/MetJ-type ribon-helix-helix transcriptional regulator
MAGSVGQAVAVAVCAVAQRGGEEGGRLERALAVERRERRRAVDVGGIRALVAHGGNASRSQATRAAVRRVSQSRPFAGEALRIERKGKAAASTATASRIDAARDIFGLCNSRREAKAGRLRKRA